MYPFLPVLLLILSGIVVVLAIGGCVFSIYSFLRTRDVRKYGKSVIATVTKITMEYVLFTRGGYTTSYFVHADWEDPQTGVMHHFKSDAGGVYLSIDHPPGSVIDVLIDPRNPRRYEVQLKFEERSYV